MTNTHVVNVIKYVKQSGESYSALHKDIGYHSIELDGVYHRGQRDCLKRLEYCVREYDFVAKNVLDIGCCIGGMLFPLASTINHGCGIDFNHRNINAGNIIKQHKGTDNLSFYVFDVDREDLNFIKNFMRKIDVVFLYSVCMWIRNWRQVIDFVAANSPVLFIETNGSPTQQDEQLNYCKGKFPTVKMLYGQSTDDDGQRNRRLYVCTR